MSKKTIYAKHTSIINVERNKAAEFLTENHKQQSLSNNGGSHFIALLFEEEIVAIAQFGAPRTTSKQREYSTELLRLAFKKDVRVVGGASKLIKYYISEYNPADIFTYQDTTGENTKVYEHSGFTFVSQDKKKEYLVAPGRSLETGSRKEVLGMPYAMQYGPDRILGTKLGEVIDPETGKRKSNKRIFIEDLGWHIETTPGDKVYEWFNPNMTHYVYKITATDSDKYYYGVSHVKKANATIDDCLNDGYYGSGGEKFKNWKKKHDGKLIKEVLALYSKKMEAYDTERQVIGNSFKDDNLCLNSAIGGKTGGINSSSNINVMLKCPVHGVTKHKVTKCMKCVSDSNNIIRNCEIHGMVNHKRDSCSMCASGKRIKVEFCKIHGLTKHSKTKCMKCSASKSTTIQNCEIHGNSYYRGNSCMKCYSEKNLDIKNCEIHGETFHANNKCKKCISSESIYLQDCEIHGETKHQGNICLTCAARKTIQNKECAIHGDTKHFKDICAKCQSTKQISRKVCNIHGETKHRGESCIKCSTLSRISIKTCKEHGETKHRGSSCIKCSVKSVFTIKNCNIHGEAKHRGNNCSKCASMKVAHNRFHTATHKKADCAHCN